jgi:hypothetical protein
LNYFAGQLGDLSRFIISFFTVCWSLKMIEREAPEVYASQLDMEPSHISSPPCYGQFSLGILELSLVAISQVEMQNHLVREAEAGYHSNNVAASLHQASGSTYTTPSLICKAMKIQIY